MSDNAVPPAPPIGAPNSTIPSVCLDIAAGLSVVIIAYCLPSLIYSLCMALGYLILWVLNMFGVVLIYLIQTFIKFLQQVAPDLYISFFVALLAIIAVLSAYIARVNLRFRVAAITSTSLSTISCAFWYYLWKLAQPSQLTTQAIPLWKNNPSVLWTALAAISYLIYWLWRKKHEV